MAVDRREDVRLARSAGRIWARSVGGAQKRFRIWWASLGSGLESLKMWTGGPPFAERCGEDADGS